MAQLPLRLLRRPASRKGQGLAEYALILLLIALAVFMAVSLLGHRTATPVENVAEALDDAQ